MKAYALNGLNQPVCGGHKWTREEWERYAARRRTAEDRRLGFYPVVSFWDNDRGQYYRIGLGAVLPHLDRHLTEKPKIKAIARNRTRKKARE